jgi:hypothetical protein
MTLVALMLKSLTIIYTTIAKTLLIMMAMDMMLMMEQKESEKSPPFPPLFSSQEEKLLVSTIPISFLFWLHMEVGSPFYYSICYLLL